MKCSASQTLPRNYDGEHVRCHDCGRKLKLHINGKIPNHNRDETKRYRYSTVSG